MGSPGQEGMQRGNCWKPSIGRRLQGEVAASPGVAGPAAGVLQSQGGCHGKRKGDFQHPADLGSVRGGPCLGLAHPSQIGRGSSSSYLTCLQIFPPAAGKGPGY